MGSVSIPDSDNAQTKRLMAIMDGGEHFVARMKALEQQEKATRAAAEEMHARIKFKGTLDDAEAHRRAAEETLDKARAEAAKIVQAATKEAEAIRVSAQEGLNKASDHAKRLKAATEAEAAEKAAAAEAKLAEAQADRDEASRLQADAKAVQVDLRKRLAEVETKAKEAENMRAQFEAKLRTLADAMARVQ